MKFLDTVLWVKEAINLGICSVLCHKDVQCTSFNFNSETNACQGHLANYFYSAGRETENEVNSAHYYKLGN